jgi:hypothetical protein
MVKDSFLPLVRVLNVFFNPEKTFETLKNGITWKDVWFPVVILLIATLVTIQLTYPVQIKESRQMIMRMDNLTDQQKEAMLDRISGDKDTAPAQSLIIGGVTPLVTAFFIAAVYLFVGNFFGGGNAKYWMLFAVTLHINMVDVLSSIVKVPLMLAQKTMMVHTSLAILFDKADLSNVWFRIAMQADLFRVWKLILWMIAFRVIYKYSAQKSLVLTGIIWVFASVLMVILQGLSPMA